MESCNDFLPNQGIIVLMRNVFIWLNRLEYLVSRETAYPAKLPTPKEKNPKGSLDSRMQLLQYAKAATDVKQGARIYPKPEVVLTSVIHMVLALEI